MFSPEVWKFFETYKEFTTNGLDLLSIPLVTPELIRVVQPVLMRLVPITFSVFLTVLLLDFVHHLFPILTHI